MGRIEEKKQKERLREPQSLRFRIVESEEIAVPVVLQNYPLRERWKIKTKSPRPARVRCQSCVQYFDLSTLDLRMRTKSTVNKAWEQFEARSSRGFNLVDTRKTCLLRETRWSGKGARQGRASPRWDSCQVEPSRLPIRYNKRDSSCPQ